MSSNTSSLSGQDLPEPSSAAPIGLSLARDPRASDDLDAIGATVDSVLELCCSERFSELDFSSLDPRFCHPIHLAAALRASSYFCDQIPSWREGLAIARAACLERGVDPEDALFGMS